MNFKFKEYLFHLELSNGSFAFEEQVKKLRRYSQVIIIDRITGVWYYCMGRLHRTTPIGNRFQTAGMRIG